MPYYGTIVKKLKMLYAVAKRKEQKKKILAFGFCDEKTSSRIELQPAPKKQRKAVLILLFSTAVLRIFVYQFQTAKK